MARKACATGQTKEAEGGVAIAARSYAGRYLSSRLGNEMYGLDISKVQEIMGLMTITHVPRMPDYVRGVINLRGHVIPVMDLSLKLGMPAGEDTEKTCIIVVKIKHSQGNMEIGLIVDEVHEVISLQDQQIDPPPDLAGSVDTEFIQGMGKTDNRVVILLDVENVVGRREIEELARLGDE